VFLWFTRDGAHKLPRLEGWQTRQSWECYDKVHRADAGSAVEPRG